MRSRFSFAAAIVEGRAYGPALDTVAFQTTAAGASLIAAAAVTGDSGQVRSTGGNAQALLVQLWTDHQVAGQVRVRSPRMHDNVDAIRSRTQIGVLDPLIPWGVSQPLYPQDVLVVEMAGSAVAGDIESSILQVFYPDLPGANARFLDWAGVKSRFLGLVGVRVALTLGTAGGYSGSKAINADVDLLRANTDYAVLGMTTDIETAAITLRGPDTANLRVAVPGENGLIHHTNYWFRRLSAAFMLPLIPIINSANKGGTFIEAVGDENGGTANVVVWLAWLQ